MRKVEKLAKRYINQEIDPNLYLFGTRSGKLSDNAKYLFLHYLQRGKKAFFVLKDLQEFELLKDKLPVLYQVELNNIQYFLKARYFFITHDIDDIFPYCNKDTKVINLWHGTPLKRMGFDSRVDRVWIEELERKGSPLLWQRWDKFCIAHKNVEEAFMSCCRFTKEQILISGLPRNDILYRYRKNKEKLNMLKKSILKNESQKFAKVVLYAPTFRDSLQDDHKTYIKMIEEFVDTFSKNYPEYLLLLRFHPLTSYTLRNISPNVLDVSGYSDVQELLLVSDMLISDYSSIIFDYSILQRPILLFPYDLQKYEEARGLYFDYYELFSGFGIFQTIKGLIEHIPKADNFIDTEFHTRFNLPNACENIEQNLLKEEM